MRAARHSVAAAAETQRPPSALSTSAGRRQGRASRCVRSAYDVDVEAGRPQAPDTAPGRWGSAPPPPPPPPPPPSTKARVQPPSRRELLFGLLGAGVATAGTSAYYTTTYDLSEDSYEKALDELFDNPKFLEAVTDEMLYRQYGDALDSFSAEIDGLLDIDEEMKRLSTELETIDTDAIQRSTSSPQ